MPEYHLNELPDQTPPEMQYGTPDDLYVKAALRIGIAALQEQVAYDARVGLLRRETFRAQVIEQISHGRREADYGKSNYALVIDGDKFKEVNDTFGHAAGDRVLAFIGQVLREHTRPNDSVCRWGGEEFGAYVEHTSISDAIEIARRFQIALDHVTIGQIITGQSLADTVTDEQLSRRLTLSIGIAELPVHGDFNESFEAADQALYFAKERGRDMIAIKDASGTWLAAPIWVESD